MSDGTTHTAGSAPTCFTPGETPEEFVACHRIADALLPPHRFRALLSAVGGIPTKALSLPPSTLQGPEIGLTEKQTARLIEAASARLPPGFLAGAKARGVSAILSGDAAYPAGLAPLSDAPGVLFVRGSLKPDDGAAIAIVGSRRATAYGRAQAERFARAFCERDVLVVSGGAAGIDTAAHQAVLQSGGRTIAVLGCGIDISYPAENRALFERIAATEGSAVISEFALGTKPEPWRFPTRNRIIAGIARISLLVESPEASGALLTATDAARYGRDVWVVPGPVDNGTSRGCHKLIQDGASLADSPEDVLEALGESFAAQARPASATPSSRSRRPKEEIVAVSAALPFDEPVPAKPLPLPPLSPDEARLYEQFSDEPCLLETAGERAGLTAPQATVAATMLEMKALIQRRPGGLYLRAPQTR